MERVTTEIALGKIDLGHTCLNPKCPNFALYQVPAEEIPEKKGE